MKRIVLSLCLSLATVSLSAYDRFEGDYELIEECCYPQEEVCTNWEISLRGAAVQSSSSRFREIYSRWSPEVQLEGARRIWENLYAWANVSYLWNHGRSDPLGNKTRVSLIPLSFGIKCVLPVACNFNVYFGAGAAYSFLHVHDDSPFVRRKTSRQEWGGVLKSGIQYLFCGKYFIEGFADYLFQRYDRNHHRSQHRVQTNRANLSGLRLGAGVGMRF
jgi:hypothetical protein